MKYDVAVIGGGLAGLALSIDLAMRGRRVVLLEKGNYPRHKVCGEYISMESHRYLTHLCPELLEMNLPMIRNFRLTANRLVFDSPLDLGGFGISRFYLEEILYKKAVSTGVNVQLNTKVSEIKNADAENAIVVTPNISFNARIVCNSTGRKSNFEVRDDQRSAGKINYVGVKYHVKIERDSRLIEIHNFPGGYCGISDIENGLSCLCYIVNSRKLRSAGNSIPELEKNVLAVNKNLKAIFDTAEFLFQHPVTISGINFNIKRSVSENIFYLGDAAGSIAPITGNGMSMALRSAFVLAKNLNDYFDLKISFNELEKVYRKFWKHEFESRIKYSRYLQKLSEYPLLTSLAIGTFNSFPGVADRMMKYSHGDSF